MSRPRFHAPSRARAAAFLLAIAAGGCLALLSAPPAGASAAGPTPTTAAAAPVAATTTPPVRLLSQNQPVTASSSGGCCPARNPVDGRSDTRWASAPGTRPAVDLRRPRAAVDPQPNPVGVGPVLCHRLPGADLE